MRMEFALYSELIQVNLLYMCLCVYIVMGLYVLVLVSGLCFKKSIEGVYIQLVEEERHFIPGLSFFFPQIYICVDLAIIYIIITKLPPRNIANIYDIFLVKKKSEYSIYLFYLYFKFFKTDGFFGPITHKFEIVYKLQIKYIFFHLNLLN